MRNRTNDKDSYSLNTSITSQYDESPSIKLNGVSSLSIDSPTPESPQVQTTQKYEFTNGHPTIKTKSTKKQKMAIKAQQQVSHGFNANSTTNENNLTPNLQTNSAPNAYNYSTSYNSYSFQHHGLPNHEQSLNDPLSSGYSIQNILNFAAQQCSTSNGNANSGSLLSQSTLNNFPATYTSKNYFSKVFEIGIEEDFIRKYNREFIELKFFYRNVFISV